MDRGAWWATVHWVAKSQTQLSDQFFTFIAINSVVIVSGGQQRDSAIHIYGSILPQTPLPSRLPYNTEQSSLGYPEGLYWLSILNTAVRMAIPNSLNIPPPIRGCFLLESEEKEVGALIYQLLILASSIIKLPYVKGPGGCGGGRARTNVCISQDILRTWLPCADFCQIPPGHGLLLMEHPLGKHSEAFPEYNFC